MVAKAATKSGEFFCFECGKQVEEDSEQCDNCDAVFDKLSEAFRCPRCSHLLPLGTALCPSCSLKFKVRSVSSSPKMTEDDRFLIKLIDWGKAPPPGRKRKAQVPDDAGVQKGAEKGKSELKGFLESAAGAISEEAVEREEPVTFDPKIVQELLKTLAVTDTNLKKVSVRKRKSLNTFREFIDANIDEKDIPKEVGDLLEYLEKEEDQVGRLQGQVKKLKSMIDGMDLTQLAEMDADGDSHGLSKKALKRLLGEREREVDDFKKKFDEIERREELMNRKIRAYAVKKKEIDRRVKELETNEKSFQAKKTAARERAPSEISRGGDSSFREEWLRDQSKIKTGLLEIKNEIVPGEEEAYNYFAPAISNEAIEKIEILEERLADVIKERDELLEKQKDMDATWKDVIALLKVLDEYLGKLSRSVIDNFVKSKDFTLYERVLDKLNI